MELIDVILSKGNLNRAYKKVVANKGASGVDGVTVNKLLTGEFCTPSPIVCAENHLLLELN